MFQISRRLPQLPLASFATRLRNNTTLQMRHLNPRRLLVEKLWNQRDQMNGLSRAFGHRLEVSKGLFPRPMPNAHAPKMLVTRNAATKSKLAQQIGHATNNSHPRSDNRALKKHSDQGMAAGGSKSQRKIVGAERFAYHFSRMTVKKQSECSRSKTSVRTCK